MAGEVLESQFVIDDEASQVLEQIMRQADETADALASVQEALDGATAAGQVRIDMEGHMPGINMQIPDEAMNMTREVENSVNLLNTEVADTLNSVREAVGNTAQGLEDGVREFGGELTDALENGQNDASNMGRGWKSRLLGLGANIEGWWNLIKGVFDKLYEVFSRLAEEADKLSMRMARFGLVADSEGISGNARGERSRELYTQHQKFAQALGIGSEGFNETVLNMYSNGAGIVKSIEDAQMIAASSYMAMDIAGLRGRDKEAVMGEVQSMVSVGIADPDQIQEAMKIAPNILRTIEKQWQENMAGKAYKLSNGEEITDATGKIAVLAQEGQITAELVAQAMINSAKETNRVWNALPNTWEKIKNRATVLAESISAKFLESFASAADSPVVENLILSVEGIYKAIMDFVDIVTPLFAGIFSFIGSNATATFDVIAGGLNMIVGILKWVFSVIAEPLGGAVRIVGEIIAGIGGFFNKIATIIPYVASNIYNIGGIFKSMIRGVKSYFMEFVNWFGEKIAGMLEMVGEFSETAAQTAKEMRAAIAASREDMAEYDKESEEIKKGWMGEEYAEYAEKNNLRWADGLNLNGFLEGILANQENAPGTKKNPAQVRGKVAIDGEYFDIIKRAAGVEIVNRYTTLRPTVNAKFGDIHQVNAQDILGELGRSIQDAEGAAISDAQALGA